MSAVLSAKCTLQNAKCTQNCTSTKKCRVQFALCRVQTALGLKSADCRVHFALKTALWRGGTTFTLYFQIYSQIYSLLPRFTPQRD